MFFVAVAVDLVDGWYIFQVYTIFFEVARKFVRNPSGEGTSLSALLPPLAYKPIRDL